MSPSPDPRRRALLALILLGIANHSVLAGSRVAVSLDALALGATPFTVGVLMALYAMLPMLLAVPAGRLCDRTGARPPMLLGCALIAAGACLPFLLRGLPALHASAALLGVGFMVFQVAAQNATGELGGDERARSFSLLALGYSISGFLGPLIAGLTIDHYGFGAAFALLALVPLAPLAVLSLAKLGLPGPHPAAAPQERGAMLELLRHPTLRRVFAINALLAVGWDLHTVFVPIYGARIGLSASEIGLVLSAFAAATFVIRFAMPHLARQVREEQVLTTALLVAGSVYLVFPFARSVGTLLPLSFCLGLGLGSGQPMVMSLLHEHSPPGRMGEAAGIRMALVQSMAVAVPLVFGALGTSVGIGPVFWTVGACLAASGLLSRRRPARRSRRVDPP
jgi:MFS family permease